MGGRRTMVNYDAGPGDYNDPDWKEPSSESGAPGNRPRVTLPLWVHLVVLVGIVILLCAGLVLIVRAIRGGRAAETPVAEVTETVAVAPTSTVPVLLPTATLEPPTATVVLPTEPPIEPQQPKIGPGATVVVEGTEQEGLRLRSEPSTQGRVVVTLKEGTTVTVVDGPEEASGYTWWKVQTRGGREGWGAADWLVLKSE
jgi:hypothetical protein